MNRPRFELTETRIGYIARFVLPNYPRESWQCRPWREHWQAVQSVRLLAGNDLVEHPPGIPWARGVDFDAHGFVEVREVADQPPVREPARLGRPPRAVYQ